MFVGLKRGYELVGILPLPSRKQIVGPLAREHLDLMVLITKLHLVRNSQLLKTIRVQPLEFLLQNFNVTP